MDLLGEGEPVGRGVPRQCLADVPRKIGPKTLRAIRPGGTSTRRIS
jgi:hypothetical protein